MFNDKSILVTGGTGSFCKKFIQTVLYKYEPNRLIVFSRDELKQFEMQQIKDYAKEEESANKVDAPTPYQFVKK